MKKFLRLLLIFGLFSTTAAQQVNLTPGIYHQPVISSPAHQNIYISVEMEESIGGIASANLLFRPSGAEFRTVEMDPLPGGLTASIPSELVEPPQIEYAIIIELMDGTTASFPQIDPLNNPQIIAIHPELKVKTEGPEFVVLYPRQGEVVYDSEVSIAVSIFDPDSSYNPVSLKLLIDGGEIIPSERTRTFIFAQAGDLTPGKHSIALKSTDFTGQPNSDYNWSFSTATTADERPFATFEWAFTGAGEYEDFAGEQEGYLRGNFRARGAFGSSHYSVRTFLTSEESAGNQPRDRFTFNLQGSNYGLTIGDSYPVFSDLVLSGKRVRGVDAGVHYRSVNLIGVFGETTKAIENSSYRRFLFGIRPYFDNKRGAHIGLSLLKSKDVISSLDEATVSPQDNLVAGIDAAWPFLERKLELSFAAALSLTAQDITGGSLSKDDLEDADVDFPFDPQDFESIIVVNESLIPPNPLKGGSLAYTTGLRLREFSHNISLNYRSIGPSYLSFGNPYLQNDEAGVSLADQFSLLERCLFVNLGLDRRWDNLKQSKTDRTTNTGGWITLAFYPQSLAPAVTLSLNYHKGANDISGLDSIFSNGDTLYIDQRREQETKTISVSLVQKIRLFDRRHSLSLTLNRFDFDDLITNRPPDFADLNSSATNAGLLWRTFISPDLNLSADFSHYSSNSGMYEYRYNQLGCALQARYLNRKIHLTLSAHRRMGEEDLKRWFTGFRSDWEFLPDQSLRAEASLYFNDNSVDEGIYRLYYFKRF